MNEPSQTGKNDFLQRSGYFRRCKMARKLARKEKLMCDYKPEVNRRFPAQRTQCAWKFITQMQNLFPT